MNGIDEIPAPVVGILRRLIGLEFDSTDPLHVKLARTVMSLGEFATYGQRITALRFDFAWELRDAGAEFGRAKADYEHHMSGRVVEIVEKAALEGRKVTLGYAEHKAQTEVYELKLAYLVAEQRERSMRKFLDALDAALENHRTDRADARRGDAAHARGADGAA